MKKLTTALLLSAVASGAALANQTGFYLGVAALTGATTAKYSEGPTARAATSVIAATELGHSLQADSGRTMFGGRITAGYGMTFAGCGWVGVEVYATALNTKMNLANSLSSQSLASKVSRGHLKNKWNAGAQLAVGYHFTKDTIGFIGIAAEFGKFELEYTLQNQSAAGVVNGTFTTFKRSKTKFYPKPVIGIRTTGIGGNRNFFVELKYGCGFVNKSSVNVPASATIYGTSTVPAAIGRKANVRPRTHEVTLTAGWRFGCM